MKREYVQKILFFSQSQYNIPYLVAEKFFETSFFTDIESTPFLCYIKIRLAKSIYTLIYTRFILVYISNWKRL